jgi:hypothetical protein
MKIRGYWLLLPLCAVSSTAEDAPCSHSAAGESHAVSLDQVGKAQEELRNRLTLAWDKAARISAAGSYDSGLPACKAPRTVRLKTRLPRELCGKTIAFAPSEHMPQADVRVATSARRIAELRADALADPKLIQRLGVRCTPTLVRPLSEVELELVENP